METIGGLAALHRSGGDERRTRILEGAFKVFLAYGFSRTTMDDIARAADLSRPALYLVFRNKADIFCAVVSCMLEGVLDTARRVLAEEGPLVDRLDRLVDMTFVAIMREIYASPHGDELIDTKNRLATDLFARWGARMEEIITEAIEREMAANGTDLAERGFAARDAAAAMMDALEGMKSRFDAAGPRRDATRALVRVLAAALRP